MTGGKRLLELVESLIPVRSTGSEGITAKELAQKLGKSGTHIYEPLSTLRFLRKIFAVKERRGVNPSVTVFFKPSKKQLPKANSAKTDPLTCGRCQRFTAIHRCVLLDLVADKSILYFNEELDARWRKEELHPDTPACEYFDRRVSGQYHHPHIHDFFRRNLSYNPYRFLCPIERCRKSITSLSKPLQVPKLGFSAIYCPSCNSPMILAYNEHFARIEVRYWDARYDFLQRDYKKITNKLLPNRPSAKHFGISIHRDLEHYLDLQHEIIYLGLNSPPDAVDRDFVSFPLKELDYITTNSWPDYDSLLPALHPEYETPDGELRRLYGKTTIYPPRAGPVSATPTALEIGGNELMIFSGYLNPPCLLSNLVTRETAVGSAVAEASSDSKEVYKDAKNRIKDMVLEHSQITRLDYRNWQQIEGGCGSLMYEPFKVEAREHGFFAPSRANARMVRYEPFLTFGLYRARSDFHSAINGVNRIVTSILKEVAYNQIEFPWFGLRGWCHQNQPQGLLYDKSEQVKIIVLVKIIQAIREGVLLPSHFMKQRGKRYDELSCIKPESEGDIILRRIAQSVLQTKVCLEGGATTSVLQIYKDQVLLFQKLFNELGLSSSQILMTNNNSREKMSPWKMLQQTRDISHFSREELRMLQNFIKNFLDNEFSFRPLTIIEIN
ncbi:MAG: hypothetical protein GPJ52_12295 [Candidatus Heimdallarchaeota archaeon]|nr:hypothetical protein [Candidatus Heimdallarchaeota archaeon]